nr:PREDICTED: uncharacterized protein LOC100878674 isoform X1 [Megachile rotundata]XP_012142850.1 PREDICTED: uncharacterized protein LOC100878674 isoform X1 [Megachile rotundata]XP_012142851.1 PREDICTED: uncharacterized protein LOC100878674 isoform X1 [Megachile rotundata]
MAIEIPTWLNADYVKRILRLAEDDNTLQVTNVITKPATEKGDNYTSDMIRVTVEFVSNQGDKRATEKKSLLFKFEPIEEGMRKDLIAKIELFDTEISALTDTMRKMNDMLGLEYRLCAKVYHVRMEPPICLVMEDLSTLGFRMANRQVGFDMDHTLLALRGLARLHAASVALCEKEPKQKQRYNNGMFSYHYPEVMKNFMITTLTALADEIETWPELGKTYADKFRTFVPYAYSKGVAAVKRNDKEFNVINHGDAWVNNMMFRYDDNGKPIQHIFVDFQLCLYTSPAVDLNYFMAINLSDDVQQHKEELLEDYLHTLSSVMKKLGCKTSPPTLDELKRYMRERAMYELISSLVMLPVMLVDKTEVLDINDMLKEKPTPNPGFKYPRFRKLAPKRVMKYVEMGLLDP